MSDSSALNPSQRRLAADRGKPLFVRINRPYPHHSGSHAVSSVETRLGTHHLPARTMTRALWTPFRLCAGRVPVNSANGSLNKASTSSSTFLFVSTFLSLSLRSPVPSKFPLFLTIHLVSH